MELRNLGRSGLRVSLVGLGCNNFGGRVDAAGTDAVVHKALDAGITLFDTADVYNRGASETLLGKALGPRRKDIVLATKFGLPMDDAHTKMGGARRYIMEAVEASLTRLGTDWIDLYQMHRHDPRTPIEETLRALDDLIRQGKARYIGCSNFKAWQMVEAEWTAKSLGLNRFISCQDEYSLVLRDPEPELIPAMQHYGLGMLPYFPLASGFLTGKYTRNAPPPEGSRFTKSTVLRDRYSTPENWDRLERFQGFAKAHGRTMLEMAFAWLAAKPTMASVIAGATKPEQIEQNARAVEWKPTDEEIAEIDKLAA
jgi:aryl-alcohol dehydrogenase-like predicted oxidoreductase